MRNSTNGRLRVWDRAQDAFSGDDLVYNFDTIDKLIGGPGGNSGTTGNAFVGVPSTWIGPGDSIPVQYSSNHFPGNKNGGQEIQTGSRTLYSVVSGLNYNDVPLGTVVQWWRPNSNVTLPDGWEPCDGRTIVDHSYIDIGISNSITLPDLRNKFVIGADAGVPGINAVAGYGLEDNAPPALNANNDWTGTKKTAGAASAAGIGYDSGLEVGTRTGSNTLVPLAHVHDAGTLSIKDHKHNITIKHTTDTHVHPIKDHFHTHNHVHLIPGHVHPVNITASAETAQARWWNDFYVRVGPETFQAGHPFVARYSHVHPVSVGVNGQTGDKAALDTGPSNPPVTSDAKISTDPKAIVVDYAGFTGVIDSGVTTNSTNDSRRVENSTGQNDIVLSVNPFPQYVGLLYIIKVKVSKNII